MDAELLKYPIGKYTPPRPILKEHIEKWLEVLEKFPQHLQEEVSRLTHEELNWRYRPEGWTIHEVVHHCADSHMNAFIRFKLTLTENEPTILPYKEAAWAKLGDVTHSGIQESLQIIQGLHNRWCALLKSMGEQDFKKSYVHPEYGRTFSLDTVTGLYAWHGSHHLAHIRQAIHYKGNF